MLAVVLKFLGGISGRVWAIAAAVILVGLWHWNSVRVARNEGRAEVQVKLDAANASLETANAAITGHESTIKALRDSLQDCIGQRTALADITDAALEETRRVGKELARTLGSKMDKLAASADKPECDAHLSTDVDMLCGL